MNIKTALVSAMLAAVAIADGNSTSSVPSSCSIKAKSTATQQSDLDKYSGCETLVGNLTISGDQLNQGALNGVQNLEGSLTIFNATTLTQFNADQLQNISHSLNLQQATQLQTASFNALQQVDTIEMIALPNLNNFVTNLKNASVIYISDTSLQTVHAFEELQQVKSFNLNNNKLLGSLESALKSVEDSLEFSANGNNSNVTFDHLQWANNITLRDVHRASFVSLEKVNASLGFINNSIDALNLSNLTSVGGSFSVVSNNQLTGVNASELKSVGGGFIIANNTRFKKIEGFHKLATVGGAITVVGNFTDLDLASLKSVKGGGQFETNSGNFSCSSLKKLQSQGGIQGDSFVCKNGATSTSIKLSSKSSSKKSSSGDNSKSSSSSGNGSSKSSSFTRSSDAVKTASADASKSSGSSSKTASNDDNSKSKGMAAAQFAPVGSLIGALGAVAAALL
ncbi:ECM33 (YBR078W) and PST1 (YDR055W) [Zygosaccharomyces parabailii]|uniref:ZYBA0S12-02102g1_1 n=1 Tax=Zygosaccharomyces bailii (strain CLIB 213 / ATCC 58445 / CBS 680 / BCRC 21525 / NBRC 1098 / NCYC 1416 / NRRL Y-2227) TaxID=1333698 RepID=A0A8J2XE23_ZYGB2|nr:ECM33 (YBR078W) and PST1 (YDR055W) [Zygosaccharomyces parabailii]CDF91576.1 ZYBA0S12-02102g1_1 [Zygosaccharomyces bailii CLIB 213]SJM86428.1 related to Cell wall protein ECM33 [Zygosaccharomyces bailii]